MDSISKLMVSIKQIKDNSLRTLLLSQMQEVQSDVREMQRRMQALEEAMEEAIQANNSMEEANNSAAASIRELQNHVSALIARQTQDVVVEFEQVDVNSSTVAIETSTTEAIENSSTESPDHD